jgi:hypothetical protein
MSWLKSIPRAAGGVPSSVSDPPRKAASGGWALLFTPGGLGLVVAVWIAWEVYTGAAHQFLLRLQYRLLELLPTAAITVSLAASFIVLVGLVLWAALHSREIGKHGLGMAWKGGIAVIGATFLLSAAATIVNVTQRSTAALNDTYLGKAPAANVCQVAPPPGR